MRKYDYDVAIVGAGFGGYSAAVTVTQEGRKALIVEERDIGGTCLNRGCIATKALLACAETLHSMKHTVDFGVKHKGFTFDYAEAAKRKRNTVQNLVAGMERSLKTKGIDLVRGKGRLGDAHTVEVEALDRKWYQKFTANKIIIATGSKPSGLPGINVDGKIVLTSDEFLDLTYVPKSMLIIGAGAVGCEGASVMNEFGCKVTVVEKENKILPAFDRQVSNSLRATLRRRGVEIYTKATVKKVEIKEGKAEATLDNGKVVQADNILVSVGRSFNTGDIGLEELGVKLGSRKEVLVDEKMESNVPGIYAIGDVTNKMLLAHVASFQGKVAAHNAVGIYDVMEYKAVPICLYTYPEASSVGLTERGAREQGYDVAIGEYFFLASNKGPAVEGTTGFIKVVADKKSDVVLGMSIVGPRASDLIPEATLCVRMGIKVSEITRTIHAHPSLGEYILEAAADVGKKSLFGMAEH